MPVTALCFDLYNTLIETGHSRDFFKEIYKASSSSFDLDYKAYKKAILTKPLEQLLRDLNPEFRYLYNKYASELGAQLQPIQLYPETLEVLQVLHKRYPLYLISNLATPYKAAFYDLGLSPFFQKAYFSCDQGDIKPAPALFKLVEGHSGQTANQLLMIGDSKKSDIAGAKKRKWQYLRIDRTKPQLGKLEIASLRQILSFISN